MDKDLLGNGSSAPKITETSVIDDLKTGLDNLGNLESTIKHNVTVRADESAILLDKIRQEQGSFNDFKVLEMKKNLQSVINKQRLNAFLERTQKRNKDRSISQRKNDATRQVLKHADHVIKSSTSGAFMSFD